MKYKLLKDLPWIKAWTIFKEKDWDILRYSNYLKADETYYVYVDYAKKYPDFFEPINEREVIYPDNLMEWYVVGVYDPIWIIPNPSYKDKDVMKNMYILWLRFPTEEKAQAYVDLKRDVARFGEVKPQTWDKWIGWAIRYNSTQNERYKININCIEMNIDFALPLDATEEEKENRVKLLKNYYWF